MTYVLALAYLLIGVILLAIAGVADSGVLEQCTRIVSVGR
jgi:hypothetical protein